MQSNPENCSKTLRADIGGAKGACRGLLLVAAASLLLNPLRGGKFVPASLARNRDSLARSLPHQDGHPSRDRLQPVHSAPNLPCARFMNCLASATGGVTSTWRWVRSTRLPRDWRFATRTGTAMSPSISCAWSCSGRAPPSRTPRSRPWPRTIACSPGSARTACACMPTPPAARSAPAGCCRRPAWRRMTRSGWP